MACGAAAAVVAVDFVLLSSHNQTAFFIHHYDWPFNVMAYTFSLSRSRTFLANLFHPAKKKTTTRDLLCVNKFQRAI